MTSIDSHQTVPVAPDPSYAPWRRPSRSRANTGTSTELLRSSDQMMRHESDENPDSTEPDSRQSSAHRRRRRKSNTPSSSTSLLSRLLHPFSPASRYPLRSRARDVSEGYAIPVPLHADSAPYQQMPSQSSLHLVSSTKEIPPLRGRSLGFISPGNPIRVWCRRLLLHRSLDLGMQALILLDVIILIYQAAKSVFEPGSNLLPGYFDRWEDIIRFIIFLLFTIELCMRIIVLGLIFDHQPGRRPAGGSNASSPKPDSQSITNMGQGADFTLQQQTDQQPDAEDYEMDQHRRQRLSQLQQKTFAGAIFQSFSSLNRTIHDKMALSAPEPLPEATHWPFDFTLMKQQSMLRTTQPYLRHSWNRLDMVSIISFWVMFAIESLQRRSSPNSTLQSPVTLTFKALSTLRAFRLLTLTKGTTTILFSLKRAGPLLVEVAFFILFAVAIFSIIGVQAFAGSFRRSCFYLDQSSLNETGISTATDVAGVQSCGSWYSIDGVKMPYLIQNPGTSLLNMTTSSGRTKGFTCAIGQVCVDTRINPHGGTQSFDNILLSAMQVIIIASANSWSPVMYQMMDAETNAAAAFFIVVLVTLFFWLFNLVIAVITSSFAAISEESSVSAFGGNNISHNYFNDVANAKESSSSAATEGASNVRPGFLPPSLFSHSNIFNIRLAKLYSFTKYFWWVLIVISTTSLAYIDRRTSPEVIENIQTLQMIITILFDVDIISRFLLHFPKWRTFFQFKRNMFDLLLAVATTVMLVPAVNTSQVYPWLTVFIIARFWRVVVGIPRMAILTVRVWHLLPLGLPDLVTGKGLRQLRWYGPHDYIFVI